MKMDERGTTVATYVFRGIEYVVSMTMEDGNKLTVEVEDRMTSDQWRGTFDADYVEDLTHKTGNFKQFAIFVSMLESALTEKSDAVALDLLTYNDLENLRNRKSGTDGFQRQKPANLQSKRYLILTYTVEFDRIHYPLPLPYMGKPDPKQLQELIKDLRKEIRSLKSQLSVGVKGDQGKKGEQNKARDLEKLRRENLKLRSDLEDLQAEFDQFKAEVKHTAKGNAAKEIRILKNVIKNLEEDLLKEKSKHQRAASKKSSENRKLLDEIDELKSSERNLRVRVKSLTNELAVLRRPGRGSRSGNTSVASRGRDTSIRSSFRSRTSSQESLSRSRDLSRNSTLSRDRSYSRERSRDQNRTLSNDRYRSRERSWSHDRSHDRSRGSAGSYRSRGSSPSAAGCRYPRFDPTAFIKEKERRNKESKLKVKRHARTNLSGANTRGKPQSSPFSSPFSERSYGSRRQRSRPSSVGSLRSRASSIESLSDVGFQSDASDKGARKNKAVLHPAQKISRTAWSSPEVSYEKSSKKGAPKVISSTPEKGVHRKPLSSNKENLPLDVGETDYFDRSDEISEIDTRLKRLQQYMKDHMP